MSVSDGGIIKPSVAAPARVPMIIYSGYPRRRNSGMDIFPTVVSVAADEPLTAANRVQPAIFVCNRPPGSQRIQGDNPRNISSESLVRYKISPIQINSGRAVSVQLEAPVQMVVIMASPGGREVNRVMPTQATPTNARPTQTELPSSAKRTNKKMMVA